MTALLTPTPMLPTIHDLRDQEPAATACRSERSPVLVAEASPLPMPVVEYPATHTARYTGDELAFLLELLGDATIARYEPLAIPLGQPGGLELVRSYIHKASDARSTTLGWVIVEAGRRVGACQMREDGDGFLVGVSLFADVRGRGLGTALFAALAAYGFGHLGAAFVAGEVEDDNLASIRALEKAGYLPIDRYSTALDNGRAAVVTRFLAQP